MSDLSRLTSSLHAFSSVFKEAFRSVARFVETQPSFRCTNSLIFLDQSYSLVSQQSLPLFIRIPLSPINRSWNCDWISSWKWLEGSANLLQSSLLQLFPSFYLFESLAPVPYVTWDMGPLWHNRALHRVWLVSFSVYFSKSRKGYILQDINCILPMRQSFLELVTYK